MSHLNVIARTAVRDEVMRQAWTLFVSQGFEATTVDQIAHAAGMSRRTFFRYFDNKDELVLQRLVEAGQEMALALRGRPRGEEPWRALRGAFQVAVDLQEGSPDVARAAGRIVRDEPAARASMEERRRRWLALLTPLVAERLSGRNRELRAAALTSAALACLDAAQASWIDQPGAKMDHLLDVAMGAVAPL